jgi:hypothetical protein
MWKKIDNLVEFEIFNIHSVLMRFSGEGFPKLPIPSGSKCYKLYWIESPVGHKFELTEYATGVNSASVYSSDGVLCKKAIHKSIESMLIEGNWWYKNGGTAGLFS